jgi:hypothetical protein
MSTATQGNSARIRSALEAAVDWVDVYDDNMSDADFKKREHDLIHALGILRKWRQEEDSA